VGILVRELTYYEENILNYIMLLGCHVDCHKFLISIKEQRKTEV